VIFPLSILIFVNLKLSATRFLSSSVQSILTENFLGKGGKSTMAGLFASKSRNEEHELVSITSEYLSTNFSWLLACRLVATTFSRTFLWTTIGVPKWVFWTIFTLLLVLHRKSLACRLFFLKSIRNCRNTHKRKNKNFLVFCNFVCVCMFYPGGCWLNCHPQINRTNVEYLYFCARHLIS